MKDNINHPEHYARLSPEPIDVVEQWGLDYHRGNALKYIARAGRKNPELEAEDLRKAAWYLVRKAEQLESTCPGDCVHGAPEIRGPAIGDTGSVGSSREVDPYDPPPDVAGLPFYLRPRGTEKEIKECAIYSYPIHK